MFNDSDNKIIAYTIKIEGWSEKNILAKWEKEKNKWEKMIETMVTLCLSFMLLFFYIYFCKSQTTSFILLISIY